MVASIHQPDFMPWMGFFNKMRSSDIFVVLDHTENNPRDAHFWCRRVKMMINKTPQWVSVPLVKPKGLLSIPISEMQINLNDRKFAKKSIQTLQQNYSKAPFFKEIFPIISQYFEHESSSLIDRNMEFVLKVSEGLDFKPQIIYSSTLDCKANATELLIEILQKVKADTYLSGTGADGYMKNEMFETNKIGLQFNNFSPIPYPQFNTPEFVGGLSIIDALMNIGFEGTKGLYSKL